MAGFNFDSIKNGFSKLGDSFKSGANDAYEEEAYEENYEDGYQEAYEEEYDDAYSEEEYADGYSEDEYEDEYGDEYEEDAYDESSYDDASYDDAYAVEDGDPVGGYYDDAEGEDGYVEEGEYDENEYAQEDYYASDYSDEAAYDSEEDYNDPKNLGYNPAVFDNLNDEDAGYDEAGYDGENAYDDGYQYDEDGVYEDDGEYYDEEAYAESEDEPNAVGAVLSNVLSFILENDIVMYIALVVLPPLGIWLLWKKNKFDITVRSAISIVSLIWMIVLIILLFSRGGDDPISNDPPNFLQHTATLVPSATHTAPVTQPTDSVSPATTPNTSIHTTNPGTADPNVGNQPVTYVWATNTDLYYHNAENCGGMTNASKMTLDSATSRGKTACPVCIGGGIDISTPNGSALPTGTQYYATGGGKWYHVDSSCQGMTGASVVTEANAIAAGKTACPKCIGYYGTPGGKWYHSVSNCSKMQNAITNTEAEWIKSGKTACPTCINSGNKVGSSVSTDTSTHVYATTGGKFYHTKEDCSGMKDASRITIQSAVSAKKQMCPKCVTPDKVMVFGTAGGTYFHTKSTCSGMKDALYVTAEYAIKYGKKACPTCAKMFVETSSNLSGSTTTTGSTGTGSGFQNTEDTIYVYATEGGTYMHLKSNCSGMANAKKVTFKQAANANKKICPTCMTTSTVKVFATVDGRWFHTVSDCQGMKNAEYVQAKTAIAYGKTACPVCAKLFSTTASTPNNGSNTNNNANNNNTTNNNTSSNTNPSFSTNNNNAPTGTASSKVYIKPGKPYYHTSASCSAQSVSGASAVTLEFAIERNYKACPSCNPPSKITY